MSYETRVINGQEYLTQTTRVVSKIKKTHIGPISNPTVDLLRRRTRLAKTNVDASIILATEAVRIDKVIESQLRVLTDFASTTGVLRRLKALGSIKRKPMTDVGPSENRLKIELLELPKARFLSRVLDRADSGCLDSQRLIKKIQRRSNNLVDSITDLVAITQESVLDVLAKDSYLIRSAFLRKLDIAISSIRSQAPNDQLGEMLAEITAIAWLDAMRCSMISASEHERRSDANHWAARAERAERRFIRLSSVCRQQKPS